MENEYLIVRYEGKVRSDLERVSGEKELFKVINDAKHNNEQIAIFKIGDCLIDWT